MEKYDVSRLGLTYDAKKIRKEDLSKSWEVIKLLEDKKDPFTEDHIETKHYLCKRKSDGHYATIVENKVLDEVGFIIAMADEEGWRGNKLSTFTELLFDQSAVGYIDSFRTDNTIYICIEYNEGYYGKI